MVELAARAEGRPFRHWLLSDPVPRALLARCRDGGLPPPHWPGWVRYDNDCERLKRTTRDLRALAVAWRDLFDHLTAPAFATALRALTGIADLRADPDLHGAGLHVVEPGGWLQSHLDYALHPRGDEERRLSLVLFLNPTWKEEWGGALELYDDDGATAARCYFPQGGAALVFENGDLSYHGTQRTSDAAPERLTAACYYLASPRPGCVRRRALFVPRRT